MNILYSEYLDVRPHITFESFRYNSGRERRNCRSNACIYDKDLPNGRKCMYNWRGRTYPHPYMKDNEYLVTASESEESND